MSKKRLFLLFILACLIIVLSYILRKNGAEVPVQIKNIETGATERKNADAEIKKSVPEIKLPNKILIPVSFITQAPFSQWDEYHEEACEEASLLMVQYFLQKKKLTEEVAENEIQKMIAFQIKNYGDYQDSNARQIVKLAADFYGIQNLKVVYDFSQEDLKKELAKGNPVIIPAAGRLLGNPNFTSPGPLYHNLVLVGYEGNTIIANDPGTRRGKGYRYDIDVLYSAIHDFPGDKNKIETGRKAMVVIQISSD